MITIKILRKSQIIIQKIIKKKLTTKALTPSINNNDNIFKPYQTLLKINSSKNIKFSTENFDIKFKHCNNITQLKNVVNRLFYKYHIPHQHSIIAALKACSRLIYEIEKNKYKHLTINSNDKEIILVNSINEDLKNYWLEIPENSYYTTEDILEVAVKIFERIPIGNKTTRVYNEYINVFGSAKRTDLAYAIYNSILTSNTVKPDINTYKTLLIACANKMELGRAFVTIDKSTISVINNVHKIEWIQWIKNIAIGMFGAKWMAYGYLFLAQDLDLVISSGKVAIIGIGIGAFLTMRLTMITILKDVILAQERKERKVSREKIDLNKVTSTELYKMTPQEIRNYMFTFLMGTLLKNGNLNEALIVLHHMTNNETPLSKETYNGIIKNLCRKKMSKVALETIEKFQEHGFHPNAETFLPVYHSLKKQGNIEEFIRLHRLMRDKNVL
ncbi:14470_t:CDS:2 [Dentiscutata erythropus]|uniref:14470_t:CDS:1 n=1 Tax=Dentiscutata erythropus TaxID=1348616 RepID=A0A9N8YPN6_9GLOM|nr:14470_t:CDS:2 [Dentiscutata erythropus]